MSEFELKRRPEYESVINLAAQLAEKEQQLAACQALLREADGLLTEQQHVLMQYGCIPVATHTRLNVWKTKAKEACE